MNNKKDYICSTGWLTGTSPVMSVGSGILVLAFVLFTVNDPEYANALYGAAKKFIAKELAWYYVGLVSVILFLVVGLVFTRFGSIRLGKDTDRPEFSNFSWFSMLFGAGIGIGILFWSIAEPISYFQGNPFIAENQQLTVEAAQVSMRVAIFHWGLHGWAIFAMIGLVTVLWYFHRPHIQRPYRSRVYTWRIDRPDSVSGCLDYYLWQYRHVYRIFWHWRGGCRGQCRHHHGAVQNNRTDEYEQLGGYRDGKYLHLYAGDLLCDLRRLCNLSRVHLNFDG